MAIRKKDGNVYVLEGPNPIVKEQVHWDPAGLVFHNFSWDEITYAQKGGRTGKAEQPTPPKADAREKVQQTPAQNTEPTRTEEPPKPAETHKPIEPETQPHGESPSEPKEFDLPYIKYKVLCYCLPASTKVHVDRLYGESWQKTTFGKKFVFPCVAMESTDLQFQFWTSDPKGQIQERSIIYPFSYEVHNNATDSYDRVPYDEYRWWKVSGKEAKEGGWLFSCVPSESHPDFSD